MGTNAMERESGRLPGRSRVIALHSSAASGRQWQALAERLHDVHFVAPDLHGHGQAPEWTHEAADVLTADVARVTRMAGDGHSPVHLVGHSYGGVVAIGVALTCPERVRSLTVFEPVLFGALFDADDEHSGSIRTLASGIARSIAKGALDEAGARFVDFWSGPGAWATMPAARRTSVAQRMPTVAAHFTGLAGSPVRLRHLRALAMPVLHLAGGDSLPPMRRLEGLLRDALPGAEFVTLAAMGHMGPLTHPHSVAQRIERHLRARFAEEFLVPEARAA